MIVPRALLMKMEDKKQNSTHSYSLSEYGCICLLDNPSGVVNADIATMLEQSKQQAETKMADLASNAPNIDASRPGTLAKLDGVQKLAPWFKLGLGTCPGVRTQFKAKVLKIQLCAWLSGIACSSRPSDPRFDPRAGTSFYVTTIKPLAK
ncbi:hypothetical protein VNO77_42159 [Canavalia gladiata]|uniref:Uncharacterized protein n=1 Tax=Canavalia gladiata TaxID=3824 RepID=A0AAN9K204_CANGL